MKQYKLFIVDNDHVFLSLFVDFFSQKGFEVKFVSKGTMALENLSLMNPLPDIIILDIMMEGMNGFEVLQKIKSISKYSNIPIIMWSNLSKQEDKDKAFSLGAALYLVKSEYLPAEMLVKIEEIIKGTSTSTIQEIEIKTQKLPPTKEDS